MTLSLLLLACTPPAENESKPGDNQDSPVVEEGPAEPAELSSGECPDFSTSGTSTFLSSDEERQVTIILPSTPGEAMPVNFFFHGVADPASTDNPGGDTARGLQLQRLADQTNTVWIVPDAPVQNLLGFMNVYLWDLALERQNDLVLYDDLRSCAAQNLDIDLSRLSAVGFSGGALWTTVIAVHRGDTLATAVELSGGSDIEAPGYEVLLSEYSSPATEMPVLLTSGAEGVDVWPSTQLAVINFATATDTLQAELLTDQHFVARCKDEDGHVMDQRDWDVALDWLAVHQFGEESPFVSGDLGVHADWCAVAE
ncbi:MAG TPA: hypothetical protein PKW90_18740 [Myxococcota bacterium]|nr:hypothetical protein [Myxococcota bacterium]